MPIVSALKPILETVLDPVVVIDRAGVIRGWNSRAEETFGWSADEAIGQDVQIIIPPALREAHRRGLGRFNVDGTARVLDRRIELTGVRRDGTEFPVELSITFVSREGHDAFVGFARDISDRRRAEERMAFQVRESRLLFELSELANRAATLEEAFDAALNAICELAGWQVGHAFLVGKDGVSLKSSVWSKGAPKLAARLLAETEKMDFRAGVGLPGRVLESGSPIWISRTDTDSNFPRRGLGFDAAFAFPVCSGKSTIAVLEFFSRDPREPDEVLLLSARSIGAQVGRVYERKRSEELRDLLVAEIDHRAKNILAMVKGVAHLSFGSATDLEQAQAAFDSRLESIAKANDMLRADGGASATLDDIVRQALTGCGVGDTRVSVDGPGLRLDSTATIMMSLAVHELCTNAFKYGALSTEPGSVRIRWAPGDQPSHFDFEWIEEGGPPVDWPAKKGFGTRILGRGIELATGGRAVLDYRRGGLHYRLTGAHHDGTAGPEAKAA